MKNSKLTFKDFELEQISREQKKTITGGGNDPVDPTSNPSKTGGTGFP